MDRRTFLTICSALGLYTVVPDAVFAKPLSAAYTADKPEWHTLEHIDGLAILAACPAICLQEICGILNQGEMISIELDDLRYVLAEAHHVTYLSGSGSGSSSMQDAVRQAMLAAPASLRGAEKLLVMLTFNQSFLRLHDLEVLQNSIAGYVGRDANAVLGTINNERMLAGEIRIGILVPREVAS